MGDCWNCTKLYQIMQSWLVCHGHEVINMNISIYNGRDQWAAEGGLRKIFTTNIWTVALTLSTVADNVPVTIGHTANTPSWGDPVGPQTGDSKTETKTINPPTTASPPLQGYLPPFPPWPGLQGTGSCFVLLFLFNNGHEVFAHNLEYFHGNETKKFYFGSIKLDKSRHFVKASPMYIR